MLTEQKVYVLTTRSVNIVTSAKTQTVQCVNHRFSHNTEEKFNPNMFHIPETGGNCFYWLLYIKTCRSHGLADGPPAEEQNIPQL